MTLMATIHSMHGARVRDASQRQVQIADHTGATLPVLTIGPDLITLGAGCGIRIMLAWEQVSCYYAEHAAKEIQRRCAEATENRAAFAVA